MGLEETRITTSEHDPFVVPEFRLRSETPCRLFEAARDGILLLDIDTGSITDANPFMYELLGVLAGSVYDVQYLSLAVDATVLRTTDGITEARRTPTRHEGDSTQVGSSDLLGHEGMLTIAQQRRGLSSVRAMGRVILKDARTFGDGFRDDVCLLLVRRRCNPGRIRGAKICGI